MTSAPRRVSVVVPTCNRLADLRAALASIRALEGPDLTFEILIGDNGTRSARHVAAEFGARHIPATHRKGPSVARNAALQAATGDYVAFLDDDDTWLGTHIRSHLAMLEANPGLEAVIGRVVTVDHEGRRQGDPWPSEWPSERNELLRRMLSGFFPQIGSVVARMSVREAVGDFDEALIGGEDLDWLLRLARRDMLGFAPAEAVLFRARPRGSYDRIQFKRLGYDRKVFLRHGMPEWRIWRTPLEFLHAYYGTMRHYYTYFVESAVHRADAGQRISTLKAVWGAMCVFPARAAYHLVVRRELRSAFIAALGARARRATVETMHSVAALYSMAGAIGL